MTLGAGPGVGWARACAPPRLGALSPRARLVAHALPDTALELLSSAHAAAAPVSASLASASASEQAMLNSLGRDMLTFLAASVLVVPVSRVLQITPVLGFLAIGCALGPHGLSLFSASEANVELGDFGILFLLFIEGLNLSPARLRDLGAFFRLGASQLFLSTFSFFFATLLGGPLVLSGTVRYHLPLDVGVIFQLIDSPVVAFCVAAAGALSSSAFVLPVLKEKGWEEKPEGIAGLSILLLQDLAVAPLLVILPLVAGQGPQDSAELGLLAFKATFGFGAVLVAGSQILRRVFDAVASARSTETFVAAALLVAVGMGQAAQALGLSASTGAFAAGVLLASTRYRAQIEADIKPFEGILLGVFFMTAGAEIDPGVVVREWPTLLTGISAFVSVKAAVLFAAGPSLGLSRAQAAKVALLLSGGGEFAFVIFSLAQDLGVLPASIAQLLTASVIISMSLTPILGEVAERVGGWLDDSDESEPVSTSLMDAAALLGMIDTDGSGTIELSELVGALVRKGEDPNAIIGLFNALDVDKSGSITLDEWEKGIRAGMLSRFRTEPRAERPDAIVVCGFGSLGRHVCDALGPERAHIAFELDPFRVTQSLVKQKHTVVYGDGASSDVLAAAGVTAPRAIVITLASAARRLDATLRLRQAFGATPVYVFVRGSGSSTSDEEAELYAAGATEVIGDVREVARRFSMLVGCRASAVERRLRAANPALELPSAAGAARAGWADTRYSRDELQDLAEEAGMGLDDVLRLYAIFDSMDVDGERALDAEDVRQMLIRTDSAPISTEALEAWDRAAVQASAEDGRVGFFDFVRIASGIKPPDRAPAPPPPPTTTAQLDARD